MRQAGFEPAHPEITRLKLVVLDHSTIDANQTWVLLTGLEPVTLGS
jgi:hypothetical protein